MLVLGVGLLLLGLCIATGGTTEPRAPPKIGNKTLAMQENITGCLGVELDGGLPTTGATTPATTASWLGSHENNTYLNGTEPQQVCDAGVSPRAMTFCDLDSTALDGGGAIIIGGIRTAASLEDPVVRNFSAPTITWAREVGGGGGWGCVEEEVLALRGPDPYISSDVLTCQENGVLQSNNAPARVATG